MRKVAFLVGNDMFPNNDAITTLRFPKNDVKKLGEVLSDSETCGFDVIPHENATSQTIRRELEKILATLTQEDTLLFYYSGHGTLLEKSRLCLCTHDTEKGSVKTTSVRAQEILELLQESRPKRRILVLDCCYSGAIAENYKAADADGLLHGLADSFGTYILTASTKYQFAEERVMDGHGIYTKALIDCLREPRQERITVDDWHNFASDRLQPFGQTPLKCAHKVEGYPIEIGNFKKKLDRLRAQGREELISKAHDKLIKAVKADVLPLEEV